MLELSH